ncbi:hypothetical protein [Vibrio phage KSF1]|uniref:Uncharacterized protein ORF VI n=1 Tax=Vibrio phage KSF1 TaxID=292443 RepID=Q64EV3_9VIRU|nr:hypothetical protein KSF-1phigpORFVI [Vibrio phage KSF1]AAU14801.1 hypothetical protein [Vibrio phage KSF1]
MGEDAFPNSIRKLPISKTFLKKTKDFKSLFLSNSNMKAALQRPFFNVKSHGPHD